MTTFNPGDTVIVTKLHENDNPDRAGDIPLIKVGLTGVIVYKYTFEYRGEVIYKVDFNGKRWGMFDWQLKLKAGILGEQPDMEIRL